jgi:hypothetical protein
LEEISMKGARLAFALTVGVDLLLAVTPSAAGAADQNVWDECNQIGDTGASIAACTRILQAPDEATSNRAIAYYMRAGA